MKHGIAVPIALLGIALCTAVFGSEPTVRISDIAQIEGVRSNQLVGYGLVVGLDGSGDSQQAAFTPQSMANMLKKFGLTLPASSVKTKNVAAVMVTAELPAFARSGAKIDVLVSSIGDAKSLQGGTLLQCPLQGADGNVYAVAQGGLSVGGFSAGGGGSSVAKNHTTAGRVPGGATVEQKVSMKMSDGKYVNVLLNNPDFGTASRIASSINQSLGSGKATALDAGTVQVEASTSDVVGLIAQVGDLPVVETSIAKVIVNERTGTVVIGGGVKLSPVAVSHGNLSVEISQDTQVSQPASVSNGTTVATAQTSVKATEGGNHLMCLQPGSTLEDLVRALNTLKVTPRDVIAILQALKESGALHAEIEII